MDESKGESEELYATPEYFGEPKSSRQRTVENPLPSINEIESNPEIAPFPSGPQRLVPGEQRDPRIHGFGNG